MNQLAKIRASLSRTQQISLILIPLIVAAGITGFVKWRHEAGFRVLFSGLSPEDASAVTQKIREVGIEFRLDETGSAVSVPSARLPEARLAIAGAGLPRSGRIGFELFDHPNLGASDFAEQVNYRRALEGELERTIATLSEIDQARVHVTFAKESVFLDARQPSKATVVLRLKRSAQLAQPSVIAVANLVSSAVDGLTPEAVAIIDANGRLLNRPRNQGDTEAQLAEANLAYRHEVESEILAKINSALGPLLGPDRYRASVSADCDFSSSEENEETVDPARSAILTAQTTEESSGSAISGGTPGTDSNLPRPTGRAVTTGAGLLRRTENTTYQPSRIVRHTVLPKGAVRRIHTAVLLDQTVRWEGAGAKARKILVPPSPDALKGVRDLVAGITGFNEQRGDQITVETLPFDATLNSEPLPPGPATKTAPANTPAWKNPLFLGAGAVALLLCASVLLFVVKKSVRTTVENTSKPAIASGAEAPAASAISSPEQRLEQQLAENQVQQMQLESEVLSRIKLPASTKKSEVLARHIRDSVQKDSGNVTNVLRTWLAEPDTRRVS